MKLIDGKIEKEGVEIIMEKLISLYGGDKIISEFQDFVKKHFSVRSLLFKHRLKKKEGLLRTSFWYHRYLSTGI